MHTSSFNYMKDFIDKYLDKNKKLSILDIGSYDVNGTYKPLFVRLGWSYTRMDIEAGPNVDIIGWENVKEKYDVIVCGQVLEHVKRPWEWLNNFKNIVKNENIICIIAPHTWPEHKYPIDTYRYFPDGMRDLFEYCDIKGIEFSKNSCDTRAIGKILIKGEGV